MKAFVFRRKWRVRPALAAVLAVSAILTFGPSAHTVARVVAAQAPRPGESVRLPNAQSPAADGVDGLPGRASAADEPAVPTGTAAKVALSTSRVFASEVGLILSPIRTTKVVDFEMVIARIHEALSKSADPLRQQQAAGWKVYRVTEPGPAGSVLFVFLMSPAVKGADYTIGKILMEAFPQEEVLEIFEMYTNSFAGPQSLLSMRLHDDFSQPARPLVPEAKQGR